MTDTDALLRERGTTHGDYSEHARCTQAILKCLMSERNWATLTDEQRESLHMFAHKMARIVTGNPNHKDHWDDIAGYARLISQRLDIGPLLVPQFHPGRTTTYVPIEEKDDENQHARYSVLDLIVNQEEWEALDPGVQSLYERLSPMSWRLKEHLPGEQALPRAHAINYTWLKESMCWLLDRSVVSGADSLPKMQRQVNHAEWMYLPKWQQEMYEVDGTGTRTLRRQYWGHWG